MKRTNGWLATAIVLASVLVPQGLSAQAGDTFRPITLDEAIEIGLTRSKNSAKGEYRPLDRNMHPLNEEISALGAPIR